MSRIDHFLKHERLYLFALISCFMLVETSINATSILMEGQKNGRLPLVWIPFLMEYSSGLALMALIPLLLLFEQRFPLTWTVLRRNIVWHLPASVAFSIIHIALMTGLRKFVFMLLGMNYKLGYLPVEFLYEYRKDAWTYVFFLVVIYCYRFIMSRLRGEASLVPEGDSNGPDKVPDRLLVKKLGREFIVRVDDIEWLESSGNYVNLYIENRIYPLRTTLSSLVDQLEPRGFRRIHRSFAVNLEFVASITPLDSGDARITLKNGKTLGMSRRYRNDFRQQLEL